MSSETRLFLAELVMACVFQAINMALILCAVYSCSRTDQVSIQASAEVRVAEAKARETEAKLELAKLAAGVSTNAVEKGL